MLKDRTSTANGSLTKAWINENEKEYLIKANSSPNTYEYFSEAYASYLASVIGLDTVRYEIVNSDLYQSILPASNQSKFIKVKHHGIRNKTSLHMLIKNEFPDKDKAIESENSAVLIQLILKLDIDIETLKKILVFDAFIGNKDRHTRNFDLYLNSDKYKFVPNIDYGASMLSCVPTWKLEYSRGIGADISKPFKDTHTKQLNFLDRFIKIRGSNLFKKDDIDEVISLIEDDMPSYIIKELPEKRWHYVKHYLLKIAEVYLRPYQY